MRYLVPVVILLFQVVGIGTVATTTPVRSYPAGIDVSRCTTAAKYIYYDVTGPTLQAVRAQMLQKGPLDKDGNQRFAYSAWTVEWEWPVDALGTPNYEGTTATCKVEVTLPRYKATSGVDPQEEQAIARTLAVIREHELHHVDHAVEATLQVQRTIIDAARRGEIKKERQANVLAFKEIDRAQAFDARYDEMTHFGESEGVWSPHK